jgi:hypothetical protein
MDLGELVSVDLIVDEKHDDTCVFCKATEPPKEIINELTDQHDEDAEAALGDLMPTYKFKNDAGVLGTALGGKPDAKTVTLDGKSFEASVAAHHLIPGNAALKESTLFKSNEYLWKDGRAKGNIGYNINSAENGVWSPGNYGVRPWGPGGAGFVAENPGLQPEDFAFLAMQSWRTQFHDAHADYSTFVKDCLDKVYEKLEAKQEIWCPEAKKKKDKKPEEKEPIYALVQRINTISARMKKMLVFPTTNWKRNIYTSRFVTQYMSSKPHQD